MLSASMAVQWENEGRRQTQWDLKGPHQRLASRRSPFHSSAMQTHSFTCARAHTHVAPWRKLQMLLSVSAHLYLAEREPSRNYTALGEAGEVAKTALLSAFSRSGVSLTDTVYCSQQNQ